VSRKRLFDERIRDPRPLVKTILDDTSPIRERTASHNSSSVGYPSSSWRFDPPRSGLKSTQQLHVDYSKFENHVFFNSAQAKVNMAFDNIINRFPFDGTKLDSQVFYDSLDGFGKYTIDRFPKHVGSLAFQSDQYINVWDRAGSYLPSISKDAEGQAVLDPNFSSFSFDFQIFIPLNDDSDTLLMPVIHKISEEGSQGFTVGLRPSVQNEPSGSIFMLVSDGISSLSGSMFLEKGKFEHIAINVNRELDDTQIELFRNGKSVATSEKRNLGKITSGGTSLMFASASSHTADVIEGTGKLVFTTKFSGSIDEFRFFHKSRSEDEINQNKDINIFKQDNLKLYFKFNESSGSHPGSEVLLDSSGNSLHSKVENYNINCRGHRGSALLTEDANFSPVLFPSNEDLIKLNKSLLFTASFYDAANPNLITRLIPHHYLKEAQIFQGLDDEEGGIGDAYGTSAHVPRTGKVTQPQIITGLLFTWASLFDNLKLFIQALGDSDFISLKKIGSVPDQFLLDKAERLGFPLPDMYSNASLAQFLFGIETQKEKGIINKSLNDVQNEVWRRVLADIPEILNSKGTIHSIECFLRDVGIEPNGIFRLREYGGSRKIYLGKDRIKRKEVTPFLEFSASFNAYAKTYDTDNLSTNFPVLRSPFLIASRSEPGSPNLTEYHNLSEYHVARGFEYDQAENLIAHFRPTSGSSGKVPVENHNDGACFVDISTLANPAPKTGSMVANSLATHSYVTGTISSKYNLESFSLGNGSSYAEIADDDVFTFDNSAFTVSLWVQFPLGYPGNSTIIFDKQNEYSLYFTDGGHLKFELKDTTNSDHTLTTPSTVIPTTHKLFDGSWHMMTCVYEGNSAQLRIYIDKNQFSSGNENQGSYASTRGTANPVKIGKTSPGNYSDCAIWNTSLDISEISAIYHKYVREEDKNTLGPDLPDGLLTSGSWSYEGWYKFDSHYIDSKPEKMPAEQSLVRLYITGTTAPASTGGLIGNLVLSSGSADNSHFLTLYMKPNISGDMFELVLTGVNYFDGYPWHISFGRGRNDLTGSAISSSYFLRAGSVSDGKLRSFAYTTKNYKDNADYCNKQGQFSSLFSSGSSSLNSSGSFFVIGESQITNTAPDALFLHDTNLDNKARTTGFKGQIGPIRFYSKNLSWAESREHMMNFRSIGVENPHDNFNFNNTRTGSFSRLRLDAHLDQDISKANSAGEIKLFDFSNNNNHINAYSLEKDVNPFEYYTMEYSIHSPHIDRSVTSSKVRVRGFKDANLIKQNSYSSFSPVYDVNPYEENLDDNRFSVEISSAQGLNEDIMNMLGTMESIEDAIGQPNLAFSSEYHDLTSLRETYFKRLEGKMNLKEFFAFFKWFDSSIGKFIDYLLPSKTNFLGTNFIIESHFLERHKFRYYFDDIYLGETDRDNLKGEIRLQLITGSVKRL
jgi:hypothetical protein